MIQLTAIPCDYYLPASKLKGMGMSYSDLKQAAKCGGLLVRWRSPKTRKVYYKSKNMFLFG